MKYPFGMLAAAFLGLGLSSTSAAACSTTTPCNVEGGEYFIALPDNVDGPIPAVIYLHGAGGSGDGAFKNKGMASAILDRGYALIAPSGMERPNRRGRNWSFHPTRPKIRNEVDFLQAVRDDALANHNIDADNIVLTGFSVGGSMTSYMACEAPDSFTAYAPVAGSFWRPHPTSCEGHVKVLHTHGWRDGTVPLEGRVLRGGDIRDENVLAQGDVFHAMEIWRETNECHFLKADSFTMTDAFWRRKWERCAPETALEFALFDGGHSVPASWAPMMLDWFEKL